MAFNLRLYGFEKSSNSTLRPGGEGFRCSCELNTPCDIMEPVFVFNGDPSVEWLTYNYIFCLEFDRYYWIDKWVWRNGMWDAHCHIDALATWRDDIGESYQYVLRSFSDYDPDVVDTTYPLIGETTVRSTTTTWEIEKDPSGSYVIGIIGGNGLVEYYYITDMPTFGAYMFGDTLWGNVVADDPGVVGGDIPTFMRAQFNPLQYVVSCIWYPFAVPHANSVSQIKFGYFDSGLLAPKVTRDSFQLFSDSCEVMRHPQKERGRYLQLSPYTRLRLSALPWGEVDLDTTKFGYGEQVYVEAWVDPITGTSKLYVGNEETSKLLTLVGQIGVTEQLSQVLKDNLATVTGAASAAAGLIGGILGGPTALVNGIANAVSGIGSAVAAQYPDVSSTGTNGARIAVTPTTVRLIQTFQLIVDEDRMQHGRPLCKVRKIRNMMGYLLILDPDVQLHATQEEIDKIKEYMVNGFYFE